MLIKCLKIPVTFVGLALLSTMISVPAFGKEQNKLQFIKPLIIIQQGSIGIISSTVCISVDDSSCYLTNILESERKSRLLLVQINPLAEDYYKRGNALHKSGDIKGAIENFNEALRINPNYADAYLNRGAMRTQSEDIKGGIEDFNEALRINPNYVLAYLNRGNARVKLKYVKEAIEDYNEAIRIDPNNAKAYYYRGNARKISANMKGAIEDYSQAIDLNHQYAEAYYNRAAINYGMITANQQINRGLCRINRSLCGDYYYTHYDYDSKIKKELIKKVIPDLQRASFLFEIQGKNVDHQKTDNIIKKIIKS